LPAYLFATLVAGTIVVAACSRTQDGAGAAFMPPNPASVAGAASITASAPSVHLRNGDGVTMLSRSLAGHRLVSVTYDPRAVLEAPNVAWEMVPGILHGAFAAPLAAVSGSGMGLRLTLHYPPSRAAAIEAARAPVIVVDYANARPLRWVAWGDFDTVRHRVSTDLPAALLADAVGVTLGLGVDNVKFHLEAPGPRYWNGRTWSKTGSIAPGKKTVVLIHGIFSSVESAFPKACPKQIADAGGFQQVLGFDYAWNEPPETEGSLFADFLKEIADAKVTAVSVEAHSYGSLVSLAAIPKVDPQLKIGNLVTMGGPLPLRGTPLANPENHWRMGLVLGLLAWYSDEPPSVVDRAYKSGMVASLATNSDALQKILTDVKAMPDKPRFVEVAGTNWICFIPGVVSGCWYSEEKFKSVLIDGSGVELPWDGVVEKRAANSTDIPKPVATDFPLSHIDVQCNGGVIKWVGKQVTSS
jgi:hypothetical protein